MIVYGIFNHISNGIYIGQTSQSLSNRTRNHFYHLRRGSHGNDRLQKSFNKHGESAFHDEEIESFDSTDECNKAEVFYISYLRFLGAKIYNLRSGGDGGRFISGSTREKHRISALGKFPSQESREKMRQAKLGTKLSLATKSKISKSQIGKIISPECRDKIRDALTGVKHTKLRRLNISKSKLGKTFVR